MEFDEKDNEVIKLLTKLKEANGGYPQDLLSARRQGYLKQLAELGVGAGAGIALKQTLKHGSGPGVPPATAGPLGTLFEALLVVAIVAEAGTVAYLNRDKLINLFRTISVEPKVQEISTQPQVTSPLTEIGLSSTPDLTETATPIGTPSPSLLAYPSLATSENGNVAGNPQVNPTSDSNGNNGNQYGLTPVPARTKDPGNNGGNPDKKTPPPKK